MPGPIWSAPWKAGPDADRPPRGPVLVSVTEFRTHQHWRALGVLAAGLRLRRSWPRTDGAIGLLLWMDPDARRSGSVSVWTDPGGLDGFVARPDHRRIMRAFRDRGRIRSYNRTAAHWDPDAVWTEARRTLTGEAPWPLPGPEADPRTAVPGQRNNTYDRANIPRVSTPPGGDMALATPPVGSPSQLDGPNQEFKDELDRLIDEQLFPQQSDRKPSAAAASTERG
ncbi:hypothetical protein [Streptacidiphilus sp. P02-A3a]|uniref:hypothetical protein n=1 Tax=Streptacidiphilus sp. P02-A3a TaxID=2704468 RepID=UPI0015FAEE25|nr:hypothetical protein [Streptacidiphilus sp. P02-A3a]QMU71183.1 hypothetical protein GXP74_26150 [Streptacidiphilus sp. P02-A3a]